MNWPAIGSGVVIERKRGVVVGLYWRARSQQVVYDVKVMTDHVNPPCIIHEKLVESDLPPWIDK